MLLPPKILATWVPLFFLSMFLCSVVEYFISWLLEKLFNTLWWDYSHYKFNINGRVCLLNSLLFGAMGIFSVHFVIPPILYVLNLLSEKVIYISSTVIAVALTVDLLITVRRLVDFSTTMERIKNLGESLREQCGHEEWFKDLAEVAVGEREGVRRKPAPDMVEVALKELGVSKDGAVYIGDSDVDINTAVNSGMPCVSVLWGFRGKDFLTKHGATQFAEKPSDLLNIL